LPVALYQRQQALISSLLSIVEGTVASVLGKPPKALLFVGPLLDECKLVFEIPGVDLALNLN